MNEAAMSAGFEEAEACWMFSVGSTQLLYPGRSTVSQFELLSRRLNNTCQACRVPVPTDTQFFFVAASQGRVVNVKHRILVSEIVLLASDNRECEKIAIVISQLDNRG